MNILIELINLGQTLFSNLDSDWQLFAIIIIVSAIITMPKPKFKKWRL